MDTLQKIFNSQLSEALSPRNIIVKILKRKLKEIDASISKKDFSELETEIERVCTNEGLIFDTCDQVQSDEDYKNLEEESTLAEGSELISVTTREGSSATITIKEFLEEYEQAIEKIPYQDLYSNLTDKWVDTTLPKVITSASSLHKELSKVQKTFEKESIGIWSEALDLLRILINICVEVGCDFNDENRNKFFQSYVVDASTRLHARACQIALEIYTLLNAGFADGAHARWRTLHEVMVIAGFIIEKGEDTAEKYLLHEGVEARKAARSYQNYCERLGYQPISDNEIKAIEEHFQQLKDRFGGNYAGDYGWASDELSNPKPNFAHIEKAIHLDHMRPYYKLSSANIHANSKGILSKLGLDSRMEDLLLVGPSVLGLADPGHGTAISLIQITTFVLTINPSIDTLAISKMLDRLGSEIGKAFMTAHHILENDLRED